MDTMEQDYYPAIYRSADENSKDIQGIYLKLIKGYLIIILIGIFVSTFKPYSEAAAVLAALFIIGGIILTIILQVLQYEKNWYNCRAIAESVKTSVWRFIMRANPFDESIDDSTMAISEFRKLILSVLNEHKDKASYLTTKYGNEEQVTGEMLKIRSMELNKRKEFYLINRIDDQRNWYSEKASANKASGKKWFVMMIILHLVAVILILLSISCISWSYWPSEVFIIGGTSIITWIKVRKYGELSAAYSLTAHEISTLRSEIYEVKTEKEFSLFVINAENAFSREHTQWLARKDSL